MKEIFLKSSFELFVVGDKVAREFTARNHVACRSLQLCHDFLFTQKLYEKPQIKVP